MTSKKKEEKIETKKRSSKTSAKEVEMKADVKAQPQAAPTDDLSEEQIAFARIQFRKNWKEQEELCKYAEILDEDADDEFIEEAKKELNDAIDKVREMKFPLADGESKEKRIQTCELIRDYNYRFNQWTNGEWRGVLSLDKMMNNLIDEIEKEDKPVELDFSSLMFLKQTFTSPRGTGVEDARWLAEHECYDEEKQELKESAEECVTYSGILRKINEHVRTIECENKRLNIYRNRLQLAYAGLRMKLNISELEEFVAFSDAIIAAGLPQSGEEIARAAAE